MQYFLGAMYNNVTPYYAAKFIMPTLGMTILAVGPIGAMCNLVILYTCTTYMCPTYMCPMYNVFDVYVSNIYVSDVYVSDVHMSEDHISVVVNSTTQWFPIV